MHRQEKHRKPPIEPQAALLEQEEGALADDGRVGALLYRQVGAVHSTLSLSMRPRVLF